MFILHICFSYTMPNFDLERKYMQKKEQKRHFLFWNNNIAKFNRIKLFQNNVRSICVDFQKAKNFKNYCQLLKIKQCLDKL